MTPEQIRENKDALDAEYRAAVKAAGIAKRHMRYLQKICPHPQTEATFAGQDTELCTACDKPFSV